MPVTRLPLTYTFRCPKEVVRAANMYVPSLQAAPSNADGAIHHLNLGQFHNFAQTGTALRATDAILCRNTAPLISMAFSLIRMGIGCKVEGRDIGAAVWNLVKRHRSARTLDDLQERVIVYREKEVTKLLEKEANAAAEIVDDRCETLLVLIKATRETPGYRASINGLKQYIDDLFGDTKADDHPILTLSTIHRSKGREWPRVFLLGANRYMPSRFAKLPWQDEQEQNLFYVAITRAMEEFTWIDVPSKGDE